MCTSSILFVEPSLGPYLFDAKISDRCVYVILCNQALSKGDTTELLVSLC
jgi:hypothetical protein